MVTKTKKKVNANVPKLCGFLTKDLEMFVEQADMTSRVAGNKHDDFIPLIKEFRSSIKDKHTVNYVFWFIVKLYVNKEYPRKSILGCILGKFLPYDFYVYQLIDKDQVAYVGKTDRLSKRIGQHKQSGKVFDNVKVYPCKNEKEQDVMENTCIFKLMPPLNKTVRTDLVNHALEVPEFTDIIEFKPDFVAISTSEIRLSITEGYYYLQSIGYISKDKVELPYWFRPDFMPLSSPIKYLTKARDLIRQFRIDNGEEVNREMLSQILKFLDISGSPSAMKEKAGLVKGYNIIFTEDGFDFSFSGRDLLTREEAYEQFKIAMSKSK